MPMDPVLAGLLANVAYTCLKGGFSIPFRMTVEDRVRDAAEEVAEDRSGLEAEDLITVLQSDKVSERAEAFRKEGKPLPVDDLASVFANHPAAKFLHDDAEVVVEEFLGAIERELASEPELWRRLILQYVKDQSADVDGLQGAVETLKDRVEALSGLVEPEPLKDAINQIRSQGFELLTAEEFENGPSHIEDCWRRPFTFTEIREGYAVDRQRPPTEQVRRDESGTGEDRVNIPQQLTEQLIDGVQRVVLGSPGAGKSTILKSVASKWHQRGDTGEIVYYRRGNVSGTGIDSATTFQEAIETLAEDDSPVLVIAEDAARQGAVPLFEVIANHRNEERVSYLLDSREHEWDPDRFRERVSEYADIDTTSDIGQQVLNTQSSSIGRIYTPQLDKTEVGRIVTRFETVTDEEVPQEPDQIFERIRVEDGTSPMLLLIYHLPAGPLTGLSDAGKDESMLEKNVREVFEAITEPDQSDLDLVSSETETDADLIEQLGLAINVTNAMEVGVRRELLLTLGETDDQRKKIDQFVDKLNGALLFGEKGENEYWSHHELWSYLYLEQHLKQGESIARQAFEACANDLLSITSESVRNNIERYLGRPTSVLVGIDEKTSTFANAFVSDFFGVGGSRSTLAPLFGMSQYSDIHIPAACPPEIEVDCAYWRGHMWRAMGELDIAENEYEMARERAENVETDPRRAKHEAL